MFAGNGQMELSIYLKLGIKEMFFYEKNHELFDELC
jgi:hypothetical protein